MTTLSHIYIYIYIYLITFYGEAFIVSGYKYMTINRVYTIWLLNSTPVWINSALSLNYLC